MKTAERTTDAPGRRGLEYGSTSAFHSSKIHNAHLEKLAIVYVRQSSPKQVMEHRESRERQYALVELATALGWTTERILVIDEDQGQSGKWADNRDGFQRLLGEVTMDHGGLVVGLEMSRLARSSKDWCHLFELCGIFGTLLADEDGVYDVNDPTDRMVLGLKGIMSELELQTMRNRLHRGAMNKARRGELFHSVPVGYIILPNDEGVSPPEPFSAPADNAIESGRRSANWCNRVHSFPRTQTWLATPSVVPTTAFALEHWHPPTTSQTRRHP